MNAILAALLLQAGYNAALVAIGAGLLGFAAGATGSFLFLRKRALVSDAIAHATLPGVGLAFIIMVMLGGDGRNLAGLLAGSAMTAWTGLLLMEWIARRTRLSEDTAIGAVLIRRGALTRENVSMQSIRAWLAANPGEAAGVMRTNASYVFFREVTASANDGPPGAQAVPLTAGRSLAVDRKFLPLGLPIWLDASHPEGGANSSSGEARIRRLVVAQDTGGAIRGPVRVDFFWGFGADAGTQAGRMRQALKTWVLLPKGFPLKPDGTP